MWQIAKGTICQIVLQGYVADFIAGRPFRQMKQGDDGGCQLFVLS
jgi:hypothetical protein